MLSSKRRYLALVHNVTSTQWLQECLRHPSPYMRPIHVKIVALELRRRGALPRDARQ